MSLKALDADGKIIFLDADGIGTEADPIMVKHLVDNFPSPVTEIAVSNFPATQSVSGNFYPATQPISGTVEISNFPATATELTIGNLPETQVVSGVVEVTNFPVLATEMTVSNFPVTQPISGSVAVSNLPATQPISGSVAVSNFPVPVTEVNIGNLPATQPVSGSVAINNFPTPVTSIAVSNLPVTQAVSGTVAVANLPATQPVSGSVAVSNFPAPVTAVSVSNFPAAVTSVAVSNLPNIQSVSGNVSVSNFPATQSINATALPLPADAATQTTSAAILAKIIAAPATEAKQDTQLAQFTSNFGAIDSVAAATDTGTENLLALIKRLLGVKLPTALVRDRLKTDSLVRNMLRKLRDDFPGSALNPAIWTVVQTGAGQTIAVTNSELRITTGTTANSETIIRSVEKFTMPFRTWFIASLSQRIINQEFYLEIVDATGGHYASWMFDFTNANGAKFLSGNSGNTLGTTNTGNVGSSTNLYQIFEIECSPDEINFFTRASDSNASRFNTAGTKSRQIPDPNLEYFVQIRVKNLATAPATSTALNIDSISIQDIEELAVEVTGGRGGVNANQAIPAAIASSIALPVQNVTGRLDVNDFQLTTIETAIALAANAVYGGVARDSSTIKNTIRGWIFTDQPGTLIFEQSTSNTTFRQTDSVAVVGNATQVTRYEFKLVTRYYKIRYVNGATAQTTLDIISTAFNIGA